MYGGLPGSETFDQLTDITGSSVYVYEGGVLSLPGVTSYHGGTTGGYRFLSASGAGSVLDLSSVTTITENPANYSIYVQASAGGAVLLPNMATQDALLRVESDGVDSLIDLSSLTNWDGYGVTGGTSYLEAQNRARILVPLLKQLTHVEWRVHEDSPVATSQVTSFTDATLRVYGGLPGSETFDQLTDITGSSVYVYEGAELSLPGVTSYHAGTTAGYRYLSASGAGSVLDLSSVTTITENPANYSIYVQASAGGAVLLPNMATQDALLRVESDGVDSLIDLSSLTNWDGYGVTGGTSYLEARNEARILVPLLAQLTHVEWRVHADSPVATSQVTSITDATLQVYGGLPGSETFDQLIDITGSSVLVYEGGVLSLPGVTSYHGGTTAGYRYLRASDAGSVLDLSGVTAITENQANYQIYIQAFSGGAVWLPNMGTQDAFLRVESDGVDSLIDLSSLTNWDGFGVTSGTSYLEARNQGSILVPLLAQLTHVEWRVHADSPVATSQVTSITDATLQVYGGLPGSETFDQLIDITGSSVLVYEGGVLSLPGVTSYHGGTTAGYRYLRASDAGSVLDLSGVTAITENQANYQIYIQAFSGGAVWLPNMGTQDAFLRVESDGVDSLIDLSSLTNWDGFGVTSGTSYLEARNQGAILVPLLTQLTHVEWRVHADSPVATSQVTSITDATLQVYGGLPGSETFDQLIDITGSSVLVYEGGVLSLPGLTSYHGGTAAGYRYLSASGAGSVLDLSNLTTITENQANYPIYVQALSGGGLLLGNTTSASGAWIDMDSASTVSGTVELLGTSRLQGTGVFVGDVINSAQVRPGTSPGYLKIDGNYTQTSAGTLFLELDGLTRGTQYDWLEVTGHAELAGTLSVILTGVFIPSSFQNHSFDVLSFASYDKNFQTRTGTDLGTGDYLVSVFDANGMTLLTVANAHSHTRPDRRPDHFRRCRTADGQPDGHLCRRRGVAAVVGRRGQQRSAADSGCSSELHVARYHGDADSRSSTGTDWGGRVPGYGDRHWGR